MPRAKKKKKRKKKKHAHIYINILLCGYIWDLITSGNINNPSGAFPPAAQFMTSEQAEWAVEEENVENMEYSRPLRSDNDEDCLYSLLILDRYQTKKRVALPIPFYCGRLLFSV